MGFSVSGSAAIVFAGMFIAFGMLQPAVSNGLEEVSDARAESGDRLLDQQNTAIEIVNATYDGAGNVTVLVDNTGTTAISVRDADFVLDNSYESPASTRVDGNRETTAWLPGETLRANLTVGGDTPVGDRLVVAVDHGVSATTEVSN
jgi:flagellar protein FlaF